MLCYKVSVNMRFNMVNRIEGFVFKEGESAGGEGANEQRADKARGVGNGNGVDVVPSKGSLSKSLVDHWVNYLYMAACGYLWYDSSVNGVNIDLRIHDITKKPPAVLNNRGCRFVAAALNSQNNHESYYTLK